ncbi:MAG TPA: alpha/beta hydrolase [Rhizobiaceae bacterium]|nr:alpha/beta hydrolase [Rhizobiaceae bacterium]
MKAVVLVSLLLLSGCSDGIGLINVISPHKGTAVETGVAYGSDPRQRMDIYLPGKRKRASPVVVFVYGGSWRSGSRKDYGFVGTALARQGFIVAIPDYRIYPDAVFPVFVEDVAKAVAAVSRTLAKSRPIILIGHSAGAQIAALITLDPRYLKADGIDVCRKIAGFVGLAGPYDFKPPRQLYNRIFPKPLLAASRPINFAGGHHPPSLLISGTFDLVVNPKQTKELAAALRRSGNDVRTALYPRLGHVTLIGTLAPPLRQFAPTLKTVSAFVREESRKAPPYCRG